MKRTLFVICSLSLVISCTPKTPEQQFVDDALKAIGGRDRIEKVKTIAIEATGVNYNLGQDMKPGAANQQFEISGYMDRTFTWTQPELPRFISDQLADRPPHHDRD